MLNTILLSLALSGAVQATDTTFTVEPGGRVDVANVTGTVTVRTWDRDQMRVRSAPATRRAVTIRNTGRVVYLESASDVPGRAINLEITVPTSYGIAVHGQRAAADIEGVHGDVEFRSLTGTARIRRTTGAVRAESVAGGIEIEDARGSVHVRTTNHGIVLTRVSGDVVAETINGPITMRQVTAAHIDAGTLNGRVDFSGTIAGGGRYRFSSHNGDVVLALPQRSDATVFVSTLNGSFHASFPVQMQAGGQQRSFSFVIGAGSARVEVETFNGNVRVAQP